MASLTTDGLVPLSHGRGMDPKADSCSWKGNGNPGLHQCKSEAKMASCDSDVHLSCSEIFQNV